jgi:hypothetical protein
MKTIETHHNRLSKGNAIDASPLLDAIIGHRLRGTCVEWDTNSLEQASVDRLSLFIMCGEQLLFPTAEKYLPLEAIRSSERQNPYGFYLHSVINPNEWSTPPKGVYHTVVTPDTAIPYTVGIYGSMLDLQNTQTQLWFHTVAESLRRDLAGMQDSLGRILLELSEPGLAVLFSNPEGLIVTANTSAIELLGKNQNDVIGQSYQSLLQEAETKRKAAKNRFTSIPFGDKSYTLISVTPKAESSGHTRHHESITFLFQLLRDKVAVCDIASEFLTTSLSAEAENAVGDVAQTLARELHDLRQYVERTEMLAHNKWNVTARQNLCALVTLAAGKSRAILPTRHDIRVLPFEENIYQQCCAQGMEVMLETVLWLHLHEQTSQTHTSLCLAQDDHTKIDITTTSLNGSLLHEPKNGWVTYLKQLGQELNLNIETVQNPATTAITTYIHFITIKESGQ